MVYDALTSEMSLQLPTGSRQVAGASAEGDVEVTERLLQARADHEAVCSHGRTALLSAANEGNAEIALLLLKYKDNLETTNVVSVCNPVCSSKPYLSCHLDDV